jgi:hypothetical protein
MSEQIRRCVIELEVDVLDEQVGADDGFFASEWSKHCGVVTNACGKAPALLVSTHTNSSDKLEFAQRLRGRIGGSRAAIGFIDLSLIWHSRSLQVTSH